MNEVQYTEYRVRQGSGLKVVVGPLVGLGGLVGCVSIGLIVTGFVANAQAGSRATQDEIALIVERLIGAWTFLLAVAAPSMIFVALGGYVSARAAGKESAKRALPAGLVALVAIGLLIFLMPAPVPIWLSLLLLAAPVPAAFIGVSLRRMVVRRAMLQESAPAPVPRVEQQFPRPPAHSAEDEREYAAQVAGALTRQGQGEEPTQGWAREEPAYVHAPAAPMKLEALEGLREAVRAALMTHPAATEEDFDRCWPAIRDEIFKHHTLRVYNSRGARDNGSH